MRFTLIELFNFGIYQGLHRIEPTQSGERNITLIGGMNGGGKTTILDAVFLCLYGKKASGYVAGRWASYCDVLRSRICRAAAERSASVRISLLTESGTVISVRRRWSESGGKVLEALTVEKDGTADSHLAESWDYYAEELIPFETAKFFFFDGEKISRIADDESFEGAKDSIRSAMGLTAAESLCGHIEKIRKESVCALRKSGASALSSEADGTEAEIGECEGKLSGLNERKSALLQALEKSDADLDEAEREFSRNGGSLGLSREAMALEQKALREKEAALREEALLLAANPAAPLSLCRSLALGAYKRIAAGGEARAARQSLPMVSRALESILSRFREEYGGSLEQCGRLSELAGAELADLRRKAGNEAGDDLTPAGLALLESAASGGSRQMLAVAILWGLAKSSGFALPVIIDTPMARLDSAHRKSFVERYLPNAGAQVLVLSTNEEISGRYLDEAAPHVSRAYTLQYDEAQKCSSIVPGYFGRRLSDL